MVREIQLHYIVSTQPKKTVKVIKACGDFLFSRVPRRDVHFFVGRFKSGSLKCRKNFLAFMGADKKN